MGKAAQIIREANDRWPHEFADEVEDEIIGGMEPGSRWLLVERSLVTREFHLSTFTDMASLEDHQVNQECAEDWDPVVVVDLINGDTHRVTRTYGLAVGPPDERLAV